MEKTQTIKIEEITELAAAIPSPRNLGLYFEKLVAYWSGKTQVDFLGLPDGKRVDLPLEVSVRWKGSVSGTLVVRCQGEFLDWIMDNQRHHLPDNVGRSEWLNEIGTLYCVYLIQNFWWTDEFKVGPILSRSSTPRDWPPREVDSSCSLQIDKNPVEIRLWLDDGESSPQ